MSRPQDAQSQFTDSLMHNALQNHKLISDQPLHNVLENKPEFIDITTLSKMVTVHFPVRLGWCTGIYYSFIHFVQHLNLR